MIIIIIIIVAADAHRIFGTVGSVQFLLLLLL